MTKAEFLDEPCMSDGGRVMLRPLQLDHLGTTLAIRNESRVRCWFFDGEPLSVARHLRWAATYFERDDDYTFAIMDDRDGEIVGQCSVYGVTGSGAEFGRLMVCPDVQGRGIATKAVSLAMRWAFGGIPSRGLNLGVLRLRLKVNNFAALAVYRKCGFIETKNENGVIEMEARRAA